MVVVRREFPVFGILAVLVFTCSVTGVEGVVDTPTESVTASVTVSSSRSSSETDTDTQSVTITPIAPPPTPEPTTAPESTSAGSPDVASSSAGRSNPDTTGSSSSSSSNSNGNMTTTSPAPFDYDASVFPEIYDEVPSTLYGIIGAFILLGVIALVTYCVGKKDAKKKALEEEEYSAPRTLGELKRREREATNLRISRNQSSMSAAGSVRNSPTNTSLRGGGGHRRGSVGFDDYSRGGGSEGSGGGGSAFNAGLGNSVNNLDGNNQQEPSDGAPRRFGSILRNTGGGHAEVPAGPPPGPPPTSALLSDHSSAANGAGRRGTRVPSPSDEGELNGDVSPAPADRTQPPVVATSPPPGGAHSEDELLGMEASVRQPTAMYVDGVPTVESQVY